MKNICFTFLYILLLTLKVNGQDTFSMIAIDSATGEIGSAGASCVDLIPFGYAAGFLSELIPGIGGANTQAAYLSLNQRNAKTRINRKDSAHIVRDWLVQNDAEVNPEIRQYGIVTFVGGSPQAAAFTGSDCLDYKGHRVGSYYSIQGNILLGPEVLDSMEAKFLNTRGSLACRLMSAMHGANIVGADSRCASNGTSSLFAFLKVTKPSDVINRPYISFGVRSKDGDRIEPVDSLQKLFDISGIQCVISSNSNTTEQRQITMLTNPIQTHMELICGEDVDMKNVKLAITNIQGIHLPFHDIDILGRKIVIQTSQIKSGFYILNIKGVDRPHSFKFIKQ